MTEQYKNVIKLNPLASLASLAPPKWHLEQYIPESGLVTLYGAPGCGKSFLALDVALCTANGLNWNSLKVESGGAIYIAMEGISGMPRRIAAWNEYRGVKTMDVPFWYTTNFTDLRSPQSTTDLIRAIDHDELKDIKIIVLDTLSRTLSGADENSAGEMNTALNQLDRLQKRTGAATIVVHHTAKHTAQERGSTVLRGACDTMLHMRAMGAEVQLAVSKQRDWEETPVRSLYFQKVLDSAVLTTTPGMITTLGARDMEVFAILKEGYLGAPVGFTAWMTMCEGVPETSFRRSVKLLMEAGMVERSGARGGYIPK